MQNHHAAAHNLLRRWRDDRRAAHLLADRRGPCRRPIDRRGSRRARKKGRSGHERPKSREETPKEGYDTMSRARDVAPQKLLVHRSNFKCNFCRAALPKSGARAGWAPSMKKGRSEDERPKSREETPKWANGSLDRPAPPRYRDMSRFAVAINQRGPCGRALLVVCRRLATVIDRGPHLLNMRCATHALMPGTSLVLLGHNFLRAGVIL
jgi:hypothetical protein